MTFSRIKNLTSKNLPKISEAFTIVINLTPSNAWLEGVSLRPCISGAENIFLLLGGILPSSAGFTGNRQGNPYMAGATSKTKGEETFLVEFYWTLFFNMRFNSNELFQISHDYETDFATGKAFR